MPTLPLIYLNVGGIYFTTTRQTLLSRDSFFSGLVSHCDENQTEFFIDRDPTHFRIILNHLRGSDVLPPESVMLSELYAEADFYCLDELKQSIERVGRTEVEAPINVTLAKIMRMLRRSNP